jgi:hypothetical protein
MKFLVCPQCGIDRFFVLDKAGNRRLVKVTREYEIVPIDPDESLDGYDLNLLYCLGCSWKGTKNRLVKYLT